MLFLGVTLFLGLNCSHPDNQKKEVVSKSLIPTQSEVDSAVNAKDSIAYLELDGQSEKIYFLAQINQLPYDTLYKILKDYMVFSSGQFEYFSIDSSDMNFSFSSIAETYNIPKPRLASIIFQFKYEMLTKDDIEDKASINYKSAHTNSSDENNY